MKNKQKRKFSVEANITPSVNTDVDAKLVSGSLNNKVVDQIKQNLLNQEFLLETVKIDGEEWIFKDLEDGEERVCKKIQPVKAADH